MSTYPGEHAADSHKVPTLTSCMFSHDISGIKRSCFNSMAAAGQMARFNGHLRSGESRADFDNPDSILPREAGLVRKTPPPFRSVPIVPLTRLKHYYERASGFGQARRPVLLPVFGLGLQQDRCPDEAELLAHLIDPVPLVGKMQRGTLVGEHGEGRRADGVLGDVVDLAFFEMQVGHEAVELARGDAPDRKSTRLNSS